VLLKYSDYSFKRFNDVTTALDVLKCLKGEWKRYEEIMSPAGTDPIFRAVRRPTPPMWRTYCVQGVGTYYTEKWDDHTTSDSKPDIPPLSIDWKYWHAYYASPEKDFPKNDEVEVLWYSGLTYHEYY